MSIPPSSPAYMRVKRVSLKNSPSRAKDIACAYPSTNNLARRRVFRGLPKPFLAISAPVGGGSRCVVGLVAMATTIDLREVGTEVGKRGL